MSKKVAKEGRRRAFASPAFEETRLALAAIAPDFDEYPPVNFLGQPFPKEVVEEMKKALQPAASGRPRCSRSPRTKDKQMDKTPAKTYDGAR